MAAKADGTLEVGEHAYMSFLHLVWSFRQAAKLCDCGFPCRGAVPMAPESAVSGLGVLLSTGFTQCWVHLSLIPSLQMDAGSADAAKCGM